MGETTKFTSHVSWTVAFCVRRTTFSCSEKDCGKKPDNMCALCRCILYFASFGYFEATWQTYLTTIPVSLCAAIVESLPLPIDDNLTVTFIAIAVGMLLLPYWKRNLGELNPGILFDIMSVNLLCLVADLKFILVTPKFGTLPTWSLLAQPLGHWQDLIAGKCPKLEKSRTRFFGCQCLFVEDLYIAAGHRTMDNLSEKMSKLVLLVHTLWRESAQQSQLDCWEAELLVFTEF